MPSSKPCCAASEDSLVAVIEATAEENMIVPMTQEECDDLIAQNPIIEEEDELPVEVEQPPVAPVVNEEQSLSVEPYVLLGTLKITPNDNEVCIGEVQLDGDVHILSGISVKVDRIENNTLYGVKIKKG